MLPCGLLYGVALSTIALQSRSDALLSVFFFWLGTVPSMVVAPGIIRKVLRPLQRALPRATAIGFILIGIVTIGYRLGQMERNLQASEAPRPRSQSCH